MKNIYSKAIKKLLSAKKSLKAAISSWLNALREDFSFYNSHTELLAIWTALYMTIAGVFVLAVGSKILVMFLLFALSVLITLITALFAIYYLKTIVYGNKKKLSPKIHNLLNKSFKLRTLLRFVKLPNFKHLIKRDFKFAS